MNTKENKVIHYPLFLKEGARVGNPHWDVTNKKGSHINVNPRSGNNPGGVNH
jgi:hypothetical protein